MFSASQIVHMIKTSDTKPITAAVGDGANDVSMIQEAHVGLGTRLSTPGCKTSKCVTICFVLQVFSVKRGDRLCAVPTTRSVASVSCRGRCLCTVTTSTGASVFLSSISFIRWINAHPKHCFYELIFTVIMFCLFLQNVAMITAQLYFTFFSMYSAQVSLLT